MAYIVETGELVAIPPNARHLQSLRVSDITELDKHVTDVRNRNGGYADFLMELRRGIITLLKIQNETYPFKSSKIDPK